MCQCTLFDVGGVEIHSIECIEYCTKDQSNVEDVEDRSNTPKGCNAMYVEDVKDGKRTYTHIWLITSLILNVEKSFGKLRLQGFPQPYHQMLCILKHVEDGKIDQIHIRAHKPLMSNMIEDVESPI